MVTYPGSTIQLWDKQEDGNLTYNRVGILVDSGAFTSEVPHFCKAKFGSGEGCNYLETEKQAEAASPPAKDNYHSP
ncbi:hypothetical protein L1987_45528 [Smallanthus sonchifolius]|uniref:Uncharacterized protein n=1 Tax=Smallanthus sonchifolius TaxID=185202 RepID=A0ACB9FY93_9ASTR|nr:hypothetical protein L1987_45528 [Smallanthus sonchifolius]